MGGRGSLKVQPCMEQGVEGEGYRTRRGWEGKGRRRIRLGGAGGGRDGKSRSGVMGSEGGHVAGPDEPEWTLGTDGGVASNGSWIRNWNTSSPLVREMHSLSSLPDPVILKTIRGPPPSSAPSFARSPPRRPSTPCSRLAHEHVPAPTPNVHYARLCLG